VKNKKKNKKKTHVYLHKTHNRHPKSKKTRKESTQGCLKSNQETKAKRSRGTWKHVVEKIFNLPRWKVGQKKRTFQLMIIDTISVRVLDGISNARLQGSPQGSGKEAARKRPCVLGTRVGCFPVWKHGATQSDETLRQKPRPSFVVFRLNLISLLTLEKERQN